MPQQTHLSSEKEQYQKDMAAKIRAADDENFQQIEVTIKMSRREYLDLVEAYKFLRQINPWLKSVGTRLEKLAVKAREALARADSH